MLRRQEHGVQLGVELVVDERHLELMLKVGHGAKSLDDHAALLALCVIRKQLVGMLDLDVRKILVTRCKSATRSSGVNIGCLAPLTITQTTRRSKIPAARRMILRCPFVTGSKLPG